MARGGSVFTPRGPLLGTRREHRLLVVEEEGSRRDIRVGSFSHPGVRSGSRSLRRCNVGPGTFFGVG